MNGAKYFQQIKHKIKAIAFDFDGVLVDSVNIKTEAFRELFKDKKEHVESIVAYHKKNEGISRFVKFRYIYEKLLREPCSEEMERNLGEKFSKYVFEKVCASSMISFAIPFIESIKGDFPLYIISGTPEEELKEIIKIRGWTEYFKEIIGAPIKKDEGLQRIAEKENIFTREILFLGDTMTDFKAAEKMKSCFIGRAVDSSMPFPQGTAVIGDFEDFMVGFQKERYVFKR